jgi:hypothetical protein
LPCRRYISNHRSTCKPSVVPFYSGLVSCLHLGVPVTPRPLVLFLFVGSFFSAVATQSLSCFLFLLFLFFLVNLNAEGLEIEFDLFARDRVRQLFMSPRDRSLDSSIVLDWLLCAFHIDFALTMGLRTPKKLVYHLARLNPTMSALVSTNGDLNRFSSTVCEAVFGLLVVVPLKNIDAMCTYACIPDAPRSRRFPKVRCFRGISPVSTDGLSTGDINLYARLLLANVNSLRTISAGVATGPFLGEIGRRYRCALLLLTLL